MALNTEDERQAAIEKCVRDFEIVTGRPMTTAEKESLTYAFTCGVAFGYKDCMALLHVK